MLLFLFFINLVLACHPECSYTCDNPKTYFICNNKHSDENYCSWVCDNPVYPALCEPVCSQINCKTYCPSDQCQDEHCPACQILCEALQCSWRCEKPVVPLPNCQLVCNNYNTNNCVLPKHYHKNHCELECEKPACEFRN